jgi:GTPase
MKEKRLPVVVIFGRTNVGKSTLFNRLVEEKQAITSDIPGTTRDSNARTMQWNGVSFQLIDTGGIIDPTVETMFKKDRLKIAGSVEEIDLKVQKQAVRYLKEADVVMFVADTQTGILPQDRQMVSILRKNLSEEEKSKIIVVANKADSSKILPDANEFSKLGLGQPIPVSATSGSGTGDLLDIVVQRLKKKKVAKKAKEKDEDKEDKAIRVCFIGKPNVGKSSLLNALLGYEKVIVSPVPHTTREPQDTEIEYQGHKLVFVDTAGIARHSSKQGLERYGAKRTMEALWRSDIALLIISANEGITHQDVKLAQEVIDHGKSLIIIANKWDLVTDRDTKKNTQKIRAYLPFVAWAPVQFISAKTGEKVQKIYELILEAAEAGNKKMSDSQLQHFLSKIVKLHRPAKAKGINPPHIYEIKQVSNNPLRFTVRIGVNDTLHFSYLRFISNKLRERFELGAAPIKLKIENNPAVHGKSEEGRPKGKKRPIAGRPAPAPKGYKPARRR